MEKSILARWSKKVFLEELQGPLRLNSDNNEVPGPNFTAVVIQTHFRSGSSLSGDVLQQHPDAFYIYEPLRAPFMLIPMGKDMIYPDGRIKKQPMNLITEAQTTMRGLLTCDFLNVFSEVFKSDFMLMGKKSKQYFTCLEGRKTSKNQTKNRTDDDFLACVHFLRSLCLQSKYRVLKIVRTPLDALTIILNDLPSLKVLHVVRDPRAVIVSRNSIGYCPPDQSTNSTYGCTSEICERLESDILTKRKLGPLYSDRIKTVLYEDMARRPVETAKELYQFVGMTIQQNILDYVYNITSSGMKNDCEICSVRSNSTYHIMAWRKSLDKDSLFRIQDRCNYVLKHYEYTIY
ncbi:hypothetical protein CHS0354_001459 [Potamilus streckersoni]|uniref:Sulfotransferase n=1 Tax=Potamilus streckersoni TaxID=2493646 RepID=A0AAE0W7Z9_9BIVA|nr:hypothetical protein CHS0354_001459 [Potamilus streckersoni]